MSQSYPFECPSPIFTTSLACSGPSWPALHPQEALSPIDGVAGGPGEPETHEGHAQATEPAPHRTNPQELDLQLARLLLRIVLRSQET
jgi:hypothetical protein